VRVEDLSGRVVGAIDLREREGRQRVTRELLLRPILRPQDGELYRLARRHAEAVRDWFAREVGWHLAVDAEVVRLDKRNVPAGPVSQAVAASQPARVKRGDQPFSRRRYVLLCLALAVLEKPERQVALGYVSDQIVLLARTPSLASVEFTMNRRDERSDLVAAIRVLVGWGVLQQVTGDESRFINDRETGDALYDVERRVLSRVLAVSLSPSQVARELGSEEPPSIEVLEEALHRRPAAVTDDEVNRRLRHRLAARLLEDPVVYYADLPDAERDYLTRRRVPMTAALAEATGLVPELRAEGVALVDPDDQLTDLRMPETGTTGHAALLVAERLAATGPARSSALRRFIKAKAQENAAYWRKGTREPGADAALVAHAVERLRALALVRVEAGEGADDVVHPLPALARFAVGRAKAPRKVPS